MKRKVKAIRRLRFQFGRLIETPRLSSDEIFSALDAQGMIEAVATDETGVTHYREIMSKMTYAEFLTAATSALIAYCVKKKIPYTTLTKEEATKPTDYYNPNDFGV